MKIVGRNDSENAMVSAPHQRLQRHQLLTILFAMLSLALIAHETMLYRNRSQFDWHEAHYVDSLDGRWFAELRSGTVGDSKQLYLQVRLFDRSQPLHADILDRPTRIQEENPTAAVFVPSVIQARSTTLVWNATNDILRVSQPPINSTPAIAYEMRLASMTWVQVDP